MGWTLLVIPTILLYWVRRSSWLKGYIGELKVRLAIKFVLGSEYIALHNITLAHKDGTSQIDHIVLSEYGMFVIETKNYSGWIFGTANQKRWTQKLGRQSYRFQNPLSQNKTHINAICDAIVINPEKIVSVIAFMGDAELKTEMPRNVCRSYSFISYIKEFRVKCLTTAEVDEFTSFLTAVRLKPGFITNFIHRQNVRERLKIPNCSLCGEVMTIRKARIGANSGSMFWGCTGFPDCRGSRDFE